MKRIIILTFISFITACENSRETQPNKFKDGEIVYLKPDSTKAVIWASENHGYLVDYNDSLKVRHSIRVHETEIY